MRPEDDVGPGDLVDGDRAAVGGGRDRGRDVQEGDGVGHAAERGLPGLDAGDGDERRGPAGVVDEQPRAGGDALDARVELQGGRGAGVKLVVPSVHLIPPATVLSGFGVIACAGAVWPNSRKVRPPFAAAVPSA